MAVTNKCLARNHKPRRSLPYGERGKAARTGNKSGQRAALTGSAPSLPRSGPLLADAGHSCRPQAGALAVVGQLFQGNRMLRPDRFIASCASWSEFWEGTKRLSSTSEKGAVFERLTQLYLQTVPEYQSELAHIWTLREVPPHVRKLLALPTLDEGIDFIARTRHGKYWAIQSKFRSQHDKPLTRKRAGHLLEPCLQYMQQYRSWRLLHTRHQNPSANAT